jgi:hypothetical protein
VLKAFATGISILAPAQVRRPIIAGDKLALCLSFCEIASRYFFGTVGQSSPAMSLSKASLSNWVTGCLYHNYRKPLRGLVNFIRRRASYHQEL